MAENLDLAFWDDRWQNAETGWDIGTVAPIMRSYIDHISDKSASILIPGSGSAHEAAYLRDQGFQNVHILDISPTACALAEQQFDGDVVTVHCEDFFGHEGRYDFILEQTFFCALPPSMRSDYAQKMSTLLADDGTLFGLMFDREFEQDGPPFGGSAAEYQEIFEPFFSHIKMNPSTGSIAPRQGTEIFVEMSL